MDLPATAIRVGTMLIREPRTMNTGPNRVDWTDTIHAGEVVPMFVPSSTSRLSRSESTPALTSETVSDETIVLDWITPVTAPPNRKLPNGIAVIRPIHR